MKKIKRYFAYLLVFAMVLGAVPAVKAQEIRETTPSDSDIISCVTTIQVISETTSNTRAATYKKITASKTNTYKNASGDALWAVTITATFQYNGTNVGCLSAKATSQVYDKHWEVSGERVTVDGASATGYATGKLYSGSKLIQTITKSVTISCSKDGKIS